MVPELMVDHPGGNIKLLAEVVDHILTRVLDKV